MSADGAAVPSDHGWGDGDSTEDAGPGARLTGALEALSVQLAGTGSALDALVRQLSGGPGGASDPDASATSGRGSVAPPTTRSAERPRRLGAARDPWGAGPSSPGAWVPRLAEDRASVPMSAVRRPRVEQGARPVSPDDPAGRPDPPDALADHVRFPPDTPPGR